MKVFNELSNSTLNIKAKNVNEMLKKLKLNLEAVIVLKNNIPITLQEKLSEKDDIKIISIISGG